MIEIKTEGIILEKTDLDFENQAVLNPGVIEIDGIVHMFYRAVHTGNFSTIGYCQLKDNKVIYRSDKPVLKSEFDYESHGLEDPRVVAHEDGNYYLFYTAFDGRNARVAYAVSKDLKTWEKKGVITPDVTFDEAVNYFEGTALEQRYQRYSMETMMLDGPGVLLWDKDAYIFPKKINGKYALIHRFKPGIQIAYFDKFSDLNEDYWQDYLLKIEDYTILSPRPGDNYVGGGAPVIETEKGWLFIYHRVGMIDHRKNYCVGVALLDKENPRKVISKLREQLFHPELPWERDGDVSNVVFPTGAIVQGDKLTIYYGAADKVIGARSMSLSALLNELSDTNAITTG